MGKRRRKAKPSNIYRIFVVGKEVTGTSKKRLSTLKNVIAKAQEDHESSSALVRVVETMRDGTEIYHDGFYRVVGRLRPVLYHVSGDNPFRAPQQPVHKEANLKSMVGVRMNLTSCPQTITSTAIV